MHRTINLYLVPPSPASQGNLLLPIGDTGGVLTTLSKHPTIHYPPTNQASTLPDRPGRTSTHRHLNHLDLGGNLTARPTRPCPSDIHTPVQRLISSTGSSILLSSPPSVLFLSINLIPRKLLKERLWRSSLSSNLGSAPQYNTLIQHHPKETASCCSHPVVCRPQWQS